jgi:glycosyl hydrolase family 38
VTAIRQVLLVGHTHHDVGYTNSPRIVDSQHRRIVAEVLRLCAADGADDPADGPPDGPPDPARFRWTFEVARPVLGFLAHADPADARALRRLAEEGRVAVTGGYLNMTQLPSEAELDAAYDAVGILRSAGLPVRTEQHGDVNGIAWSTVEAMRRAGMSRLVMALNPDHGRAPYEQPTGFWWEGRTGARVFVWLSTHYGIGEQWGIIDGDVAAAEAHIAAFVDRLAARADYPYDVAVVHAANDNRWPTPLFLDVVRHWNAVRGNPPMRTATIDQALDLLEPQAARADVPVVRGEWSDWWSHGHGSTAREVAVYREARSFARAAQTSLGLTLLREAGEPALAHVLGYRRGPVLLRAEPELVADLARVDEDLLLFGEHTWGSWETYAKPHSTFSHSHWNAKAGFAYQAYDLARDLAIEGMFRLAGSGPRAAGPRAAEPQAAEPQAGVLVVNPTERERVEPVEVELADGRRGRLVARAPAFGLAVLPRPEPPERRTGREIRKGRYRAVVDPASGGVVSLVDLRDGRELVDRSAPHGLGAVVGERIPAGSDHPMVVRSPKDFHPDFPGPDFERLVARGAAEPEIAESDALATITWRAALPDLLTATMSLTLYRDADVVDLDAHLVKPARWEPESVFVAFPFDVAEPRFLLETAGAVYAAETEQLPDTSKDWYSVQHAVGVTNDRHGVLWGSFDAPLVQVGGFHTGLWARTLTPAGGHVNSWLMNNLHFTNFQASQDGTRRYRYRFAAAGTAVTREQVRVYGRDLLEPLQARQYAGPVAVAGGTGLRVEPADRVLAEVRPAGDGAVRVRLRNVGAEPVAATVTWDGPGVDGGGPVTVDGYGVADVTLRRS